MCVGYDVPAASEYPGTLTIPDLKDGDYLAAAEDDVLYYSASDHIVFLSTSLQPWDSSGDGRTIINDYPRVIQIAYCAGTPPATATPVPTATATPVSTPLSDVEQFKLGADFFFNLAVVGLLILIFLRSR